MNRLTGRTRVRFGWLGREIPEVEVIGQGGHTYWRKAKGRDAVLLGDFIGFTSSKYRYGGVAHTPERKTYRPDQPPPPPPCRSVRGDVMPPRAPTAPPYRNPPPKEP